MQIYPQPYFYIPHAPGLRNLLQSNVDEEKLDDTAVDLLPELDAEGLVAKIFLFRSRFLPCCAYSPAFMQWCHSANVRVDPKTI